MMKFTYPFHLVVEDCDIGYRTIDGHKETNIMITVNYDKHLMDKLISINSFDVIKYEVAGIVYCGEFPIIRVLVDEMDGRKTIRCRIQLGSLQ